MKIKKTSYSLSLVFLRLLGRHLFIPLAMLCLVVVAGLAFIGEQNLETQQKQMVESISKSVNYHLDNGERILEAISRVAEVSNEADLSMFMKSTWEAYGYFDTLYYLDSNNVSVISFPVDKRYLGLDLSNVPEFKEANVKKEVTISDPYISLRTGAPTVYLVRELSNGSRIIGELSLGIFQNDILKVADKKIDSIVFIVDESGTLLAHPAVDLVNQQTNLGDLGILGLDLSTASSSQYSYYGQNVIGSAKAIEKTGWTVINQRGFLNFWSSYAILLLLVFLGVSLIFFAVSWNLRKQLRRNVATPFEELSEIVNELAEGNYKNIDYLSSIDASFSELKEFALGFKIMCKNLQSRETALEQAKDDLEYQVEQRTLQLVELNKELEKLSSFDGLTGINNRRYFDNFLENEWQRSIRQKTPISLMILDIDFFKHYNDFYGHQAGDDCLKQVATSFKASLNRGTDLAARYGGEEFVAVLPDTDGPGAIELAEMIRKTIEDLKIDHEKSFVKKYITVSIGVATLIPTKGSSQSEIISIADHALYGAKNEGRNKVKFSKKI